MSRSGTTNLLWGWDGKGWHKNKSMEGPYSYIYIKHPNRDLANQIHTDTKAQSLVGRMVLIAIPGKALATKAIIKVLSDLLLGKLVL